jgi:Bacterial Ig domain
MHKALGTAIILLLAGSGDALACRVPFIRTLDNQTVSGSMTVQTGKPCNIILQRTVGPMFSAQIVEQPTHGRASVGAGNRVTYVSRPGFTGRDAFTYTRSGLNRQNDKVVRTVRIAVFVRP